MRDYKYTQEDLSALEGAFSEALDDQDNTPTSDLIVSKGILKLVSDQLEGDDIALISKNTHNFILRFLDKQIKIYKKAVKDSKDDAYWAIEFQVWLGCFEHARDLLKAKESCAD